MPNKLLDFLHNYGISTGYTVIIVGIVVFAASLEFSNVALDRALRFAVALSPLWLPVALFLFFFDKWKYYVQKKNKLNQDGRVTLEIMIPEDVYKSPEAMEVVFTQLYQKASPDNLMETYLDGKHPPTYGLEMASHGGRVHFYINTYRKKIKHIVETQLYAQYPGIEIRELPVDYAAEIVWDDNEWDIFVLHFGLKKPDVYPIKTYVDFGLTDLPKEEEKNDPITPILDMLGSIDREERLWYQILVNAHRDEDFKVGSLISKPDWKGDIDKEIERIYANARKRGTDEDEEGGIRVAQLTEGEKHMIKALERSRSKFAFNTKIRVLYAAKKGHFKPGERIGAIITSFYQFQDANLNGFKMDWRTDMDYKIWADPKLKKITSWKQTMLDHYKRRYFDPVDRLDFHESILSTEELATIFHLPGRVALSPNLERIPSARGEAPPNLPVGSL